MNPGLPTASAFLDAFLGAYANTRSACSEARWTQIWNADWNRFMLWKAPPDGIEKTIMQQVGDGLGLEYCEGEPFAIDVVFTPRDRDRCQRFPLPIAAAVEHELTWRGFRQEIAKLLAIRCPLKVGITYCDSEADQSRIQNWIVQAYNRSREYFPETGQTEYLFIVGVAQPGSQVQVWKALQFRSDMTIMPPFTECLRLPG